MSFCFFGAAAVWEGNACCSLVLIGLVVVLWVVGACSPGWVHKVGGITLIYWFWC